MTALARKLNDIFFNDPATVSANASVGATQAGAVHYGTIVNGGLLIDDSADGTLLSGPFQALVPYSEGDRVGFTLKGNRPLILAVEGGFGSSDLWAGAESQAESLNETAAEHSETLRLHREHMDEADGRIVDITDVLTTWEPQIEDFQDKMATLPAIKSKAEEAQAKAVEALTKADKSVSGTSVEYAVGPSETTAPGAGWSTTQPTRTPGTFIWMRTIISKADGSSATSAPVLLTGPEGALGNPGDPGPQGAKGDAGDQGVSVTDVRTWYMAVGDDQVPPVTNAVGYGPNIAADPRFETATYAPWTVIDGGIEKAGTGAQNGVYATWAAQTLEPGRYRVAVTREDLIGSTGIANIYARTAAEATPTTWVASGIITPLPAAGVGTGIAVVTNARPIIHFGFYTESSMPAATRIRLSGLEVRQERSWTDTQPAYEPDTILYSYERVTYSTGATSVTPVSVVAEYEAAKQAVFVANLAQAYAEGLIVADESEPEHAPGRTWLKLDQAGKLLGIFQSNNGAWEQYTLLTGMLIVPGADGTPTVIDQDGMVIGQIIADAITGKSIAAGTITARELMLASIPKDRLASDVQGTLTAAASFALRTLLEPGRITVAAVPITGGVALSATIIEPAKIDFVVEGKSVAYIDGSREVMSIKNAYIRDTLVVGEHQVKTVAPGITSFSWVGAATI